MTDNNYTPYELALVSNDLDALLPQERQAYYAAVCESLGLNPLTQPFAYIRLNNKLTLYATRNATDQLRALRGVSLEVVSQQVEDDILTVTVRASLPDGRHDTDIGAVSLARLSGDARANAFMKAITKAKRRATLSLLGLSMLDESEVGSIPSARVEPLAAPALPAPARDELPGIPRAWVARLTDQINALAAYGVDATAEFDLPDPLQMLARDSATALGKAMQARLAGERADVMRQLNAMLDTAEGMGLDPYAEYESLTRETLAALADVDLVEFKDELHEAMAAAAENEVVA